LGYFKCTQFVTNDENFKTVTNFTNVVVLSETDPMEKQRQAYKYIYTNLINDFNWLLKTNDHSFIVMENLRHLLFQYETDWPLLIGQRFLKEVLSSEIFCVLKFSQN